jgi:cytidylate kinase
MKSNIVKITIGGLSGSGKSSLGRSLAERLGFSFISSGDLFRQEAKKRGISLLAMEELVKTNPDIDRAIEAGVKSYGETHSGFVFDGRLAWYSVPDSFKIRVISTDEVRVERIRLRESSNRGSAVSFEDAAKETSIREERMREQYNKLYGVEDYMDSSHFDFTIDTTGMSIEGSVNAVLAKIAEVSQ